MLMQTLTKKAAQSVALLASGYEWSCPRCEHLNHEIEVVETARCRKCRRAFVVAGAEHAYP